MVIEQCILAVIGFSSGFLVAAGVFAFTVMIGVVTRIIARTKTIRHLSLFEDLIVAGGALGSICTIYQPQLPFGLITLAVYGFFAGIYAGCLSIALAEAVNSIPVFVRRVRLRVGLAYLVLAFAVGKGFGALWQFVLNAK